MVFTNTKDAVTRESKKQLLRNIRDKNPDSVLGKMEKNLLKEINNLGIGPNGLGGKTTALSLLLFFKDWTKRTINKRKLKLFKTVP